jgi:hypothetical protein
MQLLRPRGLCAEIYSGALLKGRYNKEKWTAHAAIRRMVADGRLAKPSTLKCSDCPKNADEYDHYLGYSAEHRRDVQPVCYGCHAKRKWARGEIKLTPKIKAALTQGPLSQSKTCDHGITPLSNCAPCLKIAKSLNSARWSERHPGSKKQYDHDRYIRRKANAHSVVRD